MWKKTLVVFALLFSCSIAQAVIVPLYDPNAVHFGDSSQNSIVIAIMVIESGQAPASPTSTGVQGQIAWDADYFYVCTTTDTWKRVAIATWGFAGDTMVYEDDNTMVYEDGNTMIYD